MMNEIIRLTKRINRPVSLLPLVIRRRALTLLLLFIVELLLITLQTKPSLRFDSPSLGQARMAGARSDG